MMTTMSGSEHSWRPTSDPLAANTPRRLPLPMMHDNHRNSCLFIWICTHICICICICILLAANIAWPPYLFIWLCIYLYLYSFSCKYFLASITDDACFHNSINLCCLHCTNLILFCISLYFTCTHFLVFCLRYMDVLRGNYLEWQISTFESKFQWKVQVGHLSRISAKEIYRIPFVYFFSIYKPQNTLYLEVVFGY